MLLDTSGMFALLHAPEPFHAQAHQLYQTARVRLTHSYALAELIALAQSRGVSRAATLMRGLNIRDALTTDRHFEQEGFRRLLV